MIQERVYQLQRQANTYSTAVKFVKRDRVSRFKSRLVKRDCGAFCTANRDRLSRRVCQKRDRGNTKRDRV